MSDHLNETWEKLPYGFADLRPYFVRYMNYIADDGSIVCPDFEIRIKVEVRVSPKKEDEGR